MVPPALLPTVSHMLDATSMPACTTPNDCHDFNVL
jgi:hypothetical protein